MVLLYDAHAICVVRPSGLGGASRACYAGAFAFIPHTDMHDLKGESTRIGHSSSKRLS